jgi:hypothetical protein
VAIIRPLRRIRSVDIFCEEGIGILYFDLGRPRYNIPPLLGIILSLELHVSLSAFSAYSHFTVRVANFTLDQYKNAKS